MFKRSIGHFHMSAVVEKIIGIREYTLIKIPNRKYLFRRDLQSRKIWVWKTKNLSASNTRCYAFTPCILYSVRLADNLQIFASRRPSYRDHTAQNFLSGSMLNSVTTQWTSNSVSGNSLISGFHIMRIKMRESNHFLRVIVKWIFKNILKSQSFLRILTSLQWRWK